MRAPTAAATAKDTTNGEPPTTVANGKKAQTAPTAPTPEHEDRHKKATSQKKQPATATKEVDSDDEPLDKTRSAPTPTPTAEIEERPKKAPTTTATKDAGVKNRRLLRPKPEKHRRRRRRSLRSTTRDKQPRRTMAVMMNRYFRWLTLGKHGEHRRLMRPGG